MEEDGLPKQVIGQRLQRVSHTIKGKKILGLKVRCVCADHNVHKTCTRYRAVHLEVARFGVNAPVAWLGAWVLSGGKCKDRKARKKFRPSRKDIDEFISTYLTDE